MDKSSSYIQRLVGYPTYRLLENGTTLLSPLDVWDPPTGRRKFSSDDLYDLFRNECIGLIGDSLHRRAADTLHILIQNRSKPYKDDTEHPSYYVYNWIEKNAAYTRIIGTDIPSSTTASSPLNESAPCQPGTIDNLWFPTHQSFQTNFQYHKNYTMLVVNFGAWDAERGSYSPREWKRVMSRTIHQLYHSTKKLRIPVFWKTSPWGWRFDWNYIGKNAKHNQRRRSNYIIYHANQLAIQVIDDLSKKNKDCNLMVLDWSREILPYSFGEERSTTNMMSEDHETNAWHVSPKGRGLLLQILAFRFQQWKKNHHPKQQQQSNENNTIPLFLEFQETTEYLGFLSMLLLLVLLLILLLFRRMRHRTSCKS